VQLRYNYRIYPTLGQEAALARAFGCARVVYNDGLLAREYAREHRLPFPKIGDLSKALITQAKRTPERAWLSEAPAAVLQQSLRDLDIAYRNYFDGLKNKRQGMAPPRYKSRKDSRQAIRFTSNARWSITPGGKLRLPKVGEVRVKWSRSLPSSPSSVTVIRDRAGRHFASFVVTTDPSEVLPETVGEVGIDLGLTHFAVLSDGQKVAAPKFLRRAERKIRKAQKEIARKQKGSANRRKAKARLATLHARVADARRDHHHKLSTAIIRENQAVYVEDLCVKGLARTRLAKSVHDAGWAQFVSMLEYKATRYGRTFHRVDRWLPSSQTCHVCFVIDGPKPLNVRTWTCGACQTTHDRDVNAARIVLAAGRAERQNALLSAGKTGPIPAQRDEAGSHRGDPEVAAGTSPPRREHVKVMGDLNSNYTT
jgi:putative transposase